MNIKIPVILALSAAFMSCDSNETKFRPPGAVSTPDPSTDAPDKKRGQPVPPKNQQAWESQFNRPENLNMGRSP